MNILLIGYGAMNQRVARLAEDKGHEIVGVIDRTSKASTPYSQYQHISCLLYTSPSPRDV